LIDKDDAIPTGKTVEESSQFRYPYIDVNPFIPANFRVKDEKVVYVSYSGYSGDRKGRT